MRAAKRRPDWPWAGTGALLVLLLPVPVAADPPVPGYAAVKRDAPARLSRANVRLALAPVDWPQHGMLVAIGSVVSPRARWLVVDLDQMTVRRATTRLADGGGPARIESERIHTISADERRDAIASGNEVWSRRDSDPPVLGEPTDRLCSVVLFDGDDVLHETGSDCPRPRLVAVLEAVAMSAANRTGSPGHAPAPRPAAAPIGSAHREPDGTLVLDLRAEGEDGSVAGHGELRYAPGHPDYNHVLSHLGSIPPGGEVLVRPFPSRWPDESERPR
ncbi:hypothetical protein [Aureimonas jatrophae]|nr:hypothetical protein [Aureimonas jatrophae]